MRWICKDDIEECITEAWRTSAANALQKLIDAPTEKIRKEILRKASSTKVWRDFYDLLPEKYKKKCWYCEAEDIRSDDPVDHFRPKQEVEEAEDHPGYWWLAFDWENYRCSCTYCNSRRVETDSEGGKQNQFPLISPSVRAYSPDDDWENEEPAFLDPFNCDDFKLLWFDNDGIPMINPNRVNDENQIKIDNSIKIYHLHEKRIVRARNQVRLEIERAIRDLKKAKQENERNRIRDIKSKLQKMVRETEKLSRTAWVYLTPHRTMEEIEDILNPR